MLQLKGYYGFTLQPNFWYGIDTETNQKIVTSGWENNGMVAIYYFNAGNSTWVLKWIDIEENDFLIEEIPKVDTSDKLSFSKWLEEIKGIDWNDYDEVYSDFMVDELNTEYQYYLYDETLLFVQKYMTE